MKLYWFPYLSDEYFSSCSAFAIAESLKEAKYLIKIKYLEHGCYTNKHKYYDYKNCDYIDKWLENAIYEEYDLTNSIAEIKETFR